MNGVYKCNKCGSTSIETVISGDFTAYGYVNEDEYGSREFSSDSIEIEYSTIDYYRCLDCDNSGKELEDMSKYVDEEE